MHYVHVVYSTVHVNAIKIKLSTYNYLNMIGWSLIKKTSIALETLSVVS
jgi:hypothetical protein